MQYKQKFLQLHFFRKM